jgi:hypothetical protein
MSVGSGGGGPGSTGVAGGFGVARWGFDAGVRRGVFALFADEPRAGRGDVGLARGARGLGAPTG